MAPVDPRRYDAVESTKKRRCFATASLPAGPGATAATAPCAARPRWRLARCARSSRSRRFLSNGVLLDPWPVPCGPAAGPAPSDACRGARAARSCGAASGGTLARTPAAAAACAPPSLRHGTSSANSPDREPRTPRGTCCGAVISGLAVVSGLADVAPRFVPPWFAPRFDALRTGGRVSRAGDAAHTKHVQLRQASNVSVAESVGALGPALLAAAPSCAMTAWTRWSACARAVVVTSGLDAEARAARTPSAAVHAPPVTCRAAAAAPPLTATAAAAAAQRPGSTPAGSNDRPVPPSAPRALRTMSPAHDSTIEDIDGALHGRTLRESSTPLG